MRAIDGAKKFTSIDADV